MPLSNQCPKCGKYTWKMNVYLNFSAPASFYGAMSKKNIQRNSVKILAALWETVSWWCSNSNCMHHIDPVKQVRLESKCV